MKFCKWLFTGVMLFMLAAGPAQVRAHSLLTPSTPSPAKTNSLTFQRLWIDTNNNTTGMNLALGANGVLHAGFTAYSPISGAWPAYYATCTSHCGLAANWTTVIVGDVGAFGRDVRVAVDNAGHLSLMWYSQASVSGTGTFYYAECATSCTKASSWISKPVFSSSLRPDNSRYYALNFNGHPRFVYKEEGADPEHNNLYFAFCDASCTNSGNWSKVLIAANFEPFELSLAMDTSGGAHLAYRDASISSLTTPDRLIFEECPSDCTSQGSWPTSVVQISDLGSNEAFSLRVDAQNHPWLALYFGESSQYTDQLSYWWCNVSCNTGNWQGYLLGLPNGYGRWVDLAINSQGNPRLAYNIQDIPDGIYGLGYAYCNSGCAATGAVWQNQVVETPDDLNYTDPVSVAQGCSSSNWMDVGLYPSIVLDASGSPIIGYDTDHSQGGSCSIYTDINLVRLAVAGGSSQPSHWLIFIPSVIKH